MLTLQNFEAQVNPTILQRGKQYYKQKAVSWLEETEDNVWEAEVEGTESYQVEVVLEESGEINNLSCNCPYDADICKHEVAVLLTLQVKLKKQANLPRKQKLKKDIFQNLLQAITLQEFQDFVRHYAAANKDFKTDFELHFAEKDDRIDLGQKYKDLFQKIIRKYTNRGFIDYRGAFGLTKEVDKQLRHAQELMAKYNFRDAFAIATAALKAMMQAVQSCDDSAGKIGATLYSIGELFREIAQAERAAFELKEQVHTFLEKELQDRVYFSFGDIGYELFDIYHELAVQLNRHDSFLVFMDAQIFRLTGPYDDFQKEFFLRQKIDFLKATGKAEDADQLIQQHLDIVEIRKGEVEKAIQKKDHELAKKLIADGIELAESQHHPGTVALWQKELLHLAVLEHDTDTIRLYTRHFALDGWFKAEYYKQWKAAYPPAEWKAVIEKYIKETIDKITKDWKSSKHQYWRPAHPPLLQKLAPIYIQEQYWDRLLELVQKENNLETTLSYHEYLAPRYPAELLDIYLAAFEEYGQSADGRSAYASLAKKMKKVMQDIPAGKEQIQNIARHLIAQFPRRPAMIEELKKVL